MGMGLESERGSGSSNDFEDLTRYALTALSIPTSNAVVESLFSMVTQIKTKYQNIMKTAMSEITLNVLHLQCSSVQIITLLLIYHNITDVGCNCASQKPFTLPKKVLLSVGGYPFDAQSVHSKNV